MDYLEKISQKGYGQLKEEFSFLFEANDQKLEEMKSRYEIAEPNTVSNTNVSTQEDSEDEGEDLMETDEEKDIESEDREREECSDKSMQMINQN